MYTVPQGEITHARRRLITLIERREFTGTLTREWGVPKPSVMHIYDMVLGRVPPTFGAIFGLRREVAPAAWFYGEGEALPPRIGAAYIYPSFGKEIREKVLGEPTAALLMIEGLKEKRELARFCVERGVKYADLWACTIKRVKKDGRQGYHQRPPYRVIKALREAVHPDLWYTFPDELV
jgi:hypothetical protein